MNRFVLASLILVGFVAYALTSVFEGHGQERRGQDRPAAANGAKAQASGPEKDALQMIKEGRQTFRYDTFGDEEFWGDALQLHRAIAGEKLGGVGPGVSPKTALTVGLKVDAEALPLRNWFRRSNGIRWTWTIRPQRSLF